MCCGRCITQSTSYSCQPLVDCSTSKRAAGALVATRQGGGHVALRGYESGNVLGAIVALAVIGLACIVVVRFNPAKPVVIAAVLTSLAGVLATVPPIIMALWGR